MRNSTNGKRKSLSFNWGWSSLFAICLLVVTGCETSEQNDTARATACVNNAAKQSVTDPAGAAVAAQTCDNIVLNMTSAESGKIGFSAVLLMSQKFSSITSLVNAMKGSSNTLATGMTFLIFSGGSGNINDPNYTKMRTYANRSASVGISTVWSIIQTANLVANLGGLGSSPTLGQVTTAVSGLNAANASTPGTTENTLAQAALSAQQAACSGSGSSSTTCTKLTQATGGSSDPATIINALKAFVAAGS
jgi:hypothetical protein